MVQTEEFIQEMEKVDSLERTHVLNELIKGNVKALKEVKDSAVKASAAIKSHIDNKKRKGLRDEAAAKRTLERAAEAEERKKANNAADKVKEQGKVSAAIFRLDFSALVVQAFVVEAKVYAGLPRLER